MSDENSIQYITLDNDDHSFVAHAPTEKYPHTRVFYDLNTLLALMYERAKHYYDHMDPTNEAHVAVYNSLAMTVNDLLASRDELAGLAEFSSVIDGLVYNDADGSVS